MAERVIQAGTEERESFQGQQRETETDKNIIWTPWFMLAFTLTVVLGISGESLLTSSWTNNLFSNIWVILQGHVIIVALSWLILGILTRSHWIRIGCIFGMLWAFFMTLNILLNVYSFNHSILIQPYINVAECMALVGAYIGISIEKTLLTAWDTWIFILLPILSAIGIVLTYILTPQASILTVENALALAAMFACLAFWWLRPSCWKTIPGPTILFGSVPLLLLLLALFNASPQNLFLLQVTYPFVKPGPNANTLLFAQLIQLCLLLGCIRMIKGSRVSQGPASAAGRRKSSFKQIAKR